MRVTFSLLIIATFTTTLSADCMYQPREIVRIEIVSCESSSLYARRAATCFPEQWFSELASRATANGQGVVIKGKILESRQVLYDAARQPSIGPREVPLSEGAWLFSDADSPGCEDLQDGAIELLMSHPCCDVIPPHNFPCFFGVGKVERIPEDLARLR